MGEWRKSKLKDLGRVQTGTTPSTRVEENYGDFIPFIKPPSFQKDGTIDYSGPHLSKIGIVKGRLIPANSILMVCIGATIGKTGYVDREVSCNQQINAITLKEGLNHKFFYYLLSSKLFFNEVMSRSSQATLPMINKSKWQDIEVSYPDSLGEQKRIVHLLDTAFGEIERARGLLARNLVNAGELFESRLGEVFGRLEKEYKKQPLSELSYLKSGGTPSRRNPENWTNGNIEWYSSGELNDVFTRDSKEFITQYGLENSNARIFPEGSLLIGIYDTAALKMSISDRPVTFNQAIVGVEPSDKILMRFLMLGIEAQKSDLLLLRRGTRQKNLSLAKIKAIEVAVPPVKIQKQLIKEVDDWFESINDVRSHYTHQLNHLSELKQSLLAKAFAGEL